MAEVENGSEFMEATPKQLSLFDDPTFYESGDLEFKSAKGGIPQSLWETYSSFANTNGGAIFLGVAEKGNKLDFHGVDNPNRVIDALWSAINNRGKVSANILQQKDIEEVELSSNKVLIRINVPRANREQRPIYLNNDPFSGTYRRDHTGDYKCTADEVRRMFADQSSQAADSRILELFGVDDLHAPSVAQYRNRFASSYPTHPWLLEDDIGLLTKLGGWRHERATGRTGLTAAGLLMFGKEEAIRSAEALPQYHLDYRERLGSTPQERWSDRVTLDGTWEGNVFQFYNRVMPRLVTTLKTPFQIDKSLYRFDDSSVAEGLREAVVNSIIHADYYGQGGIVIDRYGDRIELSNPGTLLLSHEQLLRGGVSECRNKSLQLMFQMMGAGDKAGSGMDKIRSSWEDAKFRAPRIRETQRPDRVALTLPMISILPEEAIDKLRSMFGERFENLKPDETQILVMALEEGLITNARLQEVLTTHRTELTKTLQALVKEGFLRRAGTGRWTQYELIVPKAGALSQASNENHVEGGAGLGTSLDTSLGTSLGTSLDTSLGTSLGAGVGVASDNIMQSVSVPNGWAEVHRGFSASSASESGHFEVEEHRESEGLRAQWPDLVVIGEQAKGKQIPAQELEAIILQLCERAGWLNNHQIGSLLGKNATALRRRVLSGMVSRGLLRMRFPASRSHPYQAYTKADRK